MKKTLFFLMFVFCGQTMGAQEHLKSFFRQLDTSSNESFQLSGFAEAFAPDNLYCLQSVSAGHDGLSLHQAEELEQVFRQELPYANEYTIYRHGDTLRYTLVFRRDSSISNEWLEEQKKASKALKPTPREFATLVIHPQYVEASLSMADQPAPRFSQSPIDFRTIDNFLKKNMQGARKMDVSIMTDNPQYNNKWRLPKEPGQRNGNVSGTRYVFPPTESHEVRNQLVRLVEQLFGDGCRDTRLWRNGGDISIDTSENKLATYIHPQTGELILLRTHRRGE